MRILHALLSAILPASPPPMPTGPVIIRPARPPAEVIDAPVCAECAHYDPEADFEFLPMCRAVVFLREPVTGARNRGREVDCHTARSTSICGPMAVLYTARVQS